MNAVRGEGCASTDAHGGRGMAAGEMGSAAEALIDRQEFAKTHLLPRRIRAQSQALRAFFPPLVYSQQPESNAWVSEC